MQGKVTYHQQVSYCGKQRCRKCREGAGHGPYWYAYQTVDGQTTRTYIGKELPPAAQAQLGTATDTIDHPAETITDPTVGAHIHDAQPVHRSTIIDKNLPPNPHTIPEPSHPSETAFIRLCLLGQVRLERREKEQWQVINSAAWQQPRMRALLAYLVSSPRRKASRAQVMAALWPGIEAPTADAQLSRCIQSLQRVLEPSRAKQRGQAQQGAASNTQLFRIDGNWLLLAGQDVLWADVTEFEDALPDPALLEMVLSLYGGDFLPEERAAEWAVTRRQALRQRWVELQLVLADWHIEQKAWTSAIDGLDRLLAADATNEPAIRRLMLVLAQLKRRGEALRAYQRLTDLLQREYGRAPSEETRQLYEAVRIGDEQRMGGVGAMNAIPMGEAHMRIGRTHQNPLVGREQELGALRSLLQHVERSGQMAQVGGSRPTRAIPFDTERGPQCVFLMGDAGIGKTRLAEEMSRAAQGRGWTVLWSRNYAQESGIPYRLWMDVLRKAMEVASLSFISPQIAQSLSTLLPELQAQFPQAVFLAQSPEQEQLRLWEATRELLTETSRQAPLLIVLDDIQWADVSSCELLGYLARHAGGYPLLFVATCRENEISSHPLRNLVAHMQREHTVQTLSVNPLSGEQIGMLVSAIPDLPEMMIQHIQAQAAGNPFFAEELARTAPPEPPVTALPVTISAALESRLSRLSAACQRLLGNAAVLGGSFEFQVICSMESSAARVNEDMVLDLLEEALRAGVLTDEGIGTHITYAFWHPLLVQHLYEHLSGTRKVRLHQRAADVLQRAYASREDEVAATITHHLVEGGADPAQIAHYAELAGDRAYALLAYPEAEQHYRLAVEYIDLINMGVRSAQDNNPIPPVGKSPIASGGVGQSLDDPNLRRALPDLLMCLELLAECVMIQGNFAEGRRLYERILELRHAHVHDGEPVDGYEAQVQALLWGQIGLTWRYAGNNSQAQQCCKRGEEALHAAGIVSGPALARLRYQQGSLYWQEGRYDDAWHVAQEALALFSVDMARPHDETGHPPARRYTRVQRTLEGDPVDLGRAHALLGGIANSRGQSNEARFHLETALALYEQYDQKREIAHVSCSLGYMYLKQSNYAPAQAALRRALSLAERVGDGPITSVIFNNLGMLAASMGDYVEAEQWYKRSLTLAERFNDREYMSLWNAALAAVLQEQGKLSEAALCVRESLRIARAMRNDPCIGSALIALANLRIASAVAPDCLPAVSVRLLRHAQEDLQRALCLPLEAETRARGEGTLARINSRRDGYL